MIFTKAPFIQYKQILLEKNFRQYLETIMVSRKILRMGPQKTLRGNRKFDWIELSLVHDKSDKHATIYNSYNIEMASKIIKSVELTK